MLPAFVIVITFLYPVPAGIMGVSRVVRQVGGRKREREGEVAKLNMENVHM